MKHVWLIFHVLFHKHLAYVLEKWVNETTILRGEIKRRGIEFKSVLNDWVLI
jgi:hypothetical protein